MMKLSEPSANKKCREVCEVVLVECLTGCPPDDYSCLRNCLKAETFCIDGKFFILGLKILRNQSDWTIMMSSIDKKIRLSMSNELSQWMSQLSESNLPLRTRNEGYSYDSSNL